MGSINQHISGGNHPVAKAICISVEHLNKHHWHSTHSDIMLVIACNDDMNHSKIVVVDNDSQHTQRKKTSRQDTHIIIK